MTKIPKRALRRLTGKGWLDLLSEWVVYVLVVISSFLKLAFRDWSQSDESMKTWCCGKKGRRKVEIFSFFGQTRSYHRRRRRRGPNLESHSLQIVRMNSKSSLTDFPSQTFRAREAGSEFLAVCLRDQGGLSKWRLERHNQCARVDLQRLATFIPSQREKGLFLFYSILPKHSFLSHLFVTQVFETALLPIKDAH